MTELLRNGDIGADVVELQVQLVAHGASLETDGWFGDKTEQAVIAFQRSRGLVVDGIAGERTLAALNRQQRPTTDLAEVDLEWAADRLDIPLSSAHSISEVESRGKAFFRPDHPAILFERHIMYRRLGKRAAEFAASYPGIVNPRRGGYVGNMGEYPRLAAAKHIDRSAAVESCSWGRFQIMGFHWKHLNYDSAQDYEDRMRSGEGEHIRAFVRFIMADPDLHRALRLKDWAAFAHGYNGPAYRDNLYDVKLERASERYARLFGEE